MSMRKARFLSRSELLEGYRTPPEILDAPLTTLIPLWVLLSGGHVQAGNRYDDTILHVTRTLWHLHDVFDEDEATLTITLQAKYADC